LAERKLMGSIQRRKGPDVTGFWGVLQPLADGLKLLFKEIIIPYKSFKFLFFFSPVFLFVLSLLNWLFLPGTLIFISASSFFSILLTFILSGLNVYGLILAGWASNSRYSFLGSVRATAQMISYELIFGFVNLLIIFCVKSCNFIDVILYQQKFWLCFLLFPVLFFYFIIMLAETNRTPFDLAEAEAELVAGYNLEYSSIIFALFFLGEYCNMLFLSAVCICFFAGGWLSFFSGTGSIFFFIFKTLCVSVIFVWIRATLPRYRYDQLMMIGWQVLLPLIFSFFVFYIGFFLYFSYFYVHFFQLFGFIVSLQFFFF
jgi:NADH-quinone oxidoreductase subunit H